jgi:hypothetical protein
MKIDSFKSPSLVGFFVLICDLVYFYTLLAYSTDLDGGWIVSGGVALLHAGHKTGLMCTTVFIFDVTITYFVFVLGSRMK